MTWFGIVLKLEFATSDLQLEYYVMRIVCLRCWLKTSLHWHSDQITDTRAILLVITGYTNSLPNFENNCQCSQSTLRTTTEQQTPAGTWCNVWTWLCHLKAITSQSWNTMLSCCNCQLSTQYSMSETPTWYRTSKWWTSQTSRSI